MVFAAITQWMESLAPGQYRVPELKMVIEVYMPGKGFAQAFEIDAVVVAEYILIALLQLYYPFDEGLGRVI